MLSRRAAEPGPVVPASSVPSYTGTSSYLLVSKYNNYLIGTRGDGRNEIALLDPDASQKDRFSKVTVMKEVRTALSPIHPRHTPQGDRYEWCINWIAVDLDARPVELELHGHVGPEIGQRGIQRRAGAG